MRCRPGRYLEEATSIESGPWLASRAFGEGLMVVQDEAAQALSLAAQDESDTLRQVERLEGSRAGRIQPDDPVASALELGEGPGEVDHLDTLEGVR